VKEAAVSGYLANKRRKKGQLSKAKLDGLLLHGGEKRKARRRESQAGAEGVFENIRDQEGKNPELDFWREENL